MSVTRNKILRGGGRITYRGIVVYTKADITLTVNSKVQALDVAMFGKLTDSKDDVSVEIGFDPSGEVTDDLIGLFLPFFDGTIWYPGRSIFDPVIDYPLVINSRDGREFTAVNAACMTPASLACAGTKTILGGVKFIGIRANGAPWGQAGSLFTTSLLDYPGDAAFNRANIIRQPFLGRWLLGALPTGLIASASAASPTVLGKTAHGMVNGDAVVIAGSLGDLTLNGSWFVVNKTTDTFEISATSGGSPIDTGGAYTANSATFTRANVGDSFANFTTEEGFMVQPNVSLQPDKTDDGGVIDMLFTKADVKISCTPVGPTLDDLLAMLNVQGGTAVRGGDVGADALPLYLNGAGVYVKVPLAALVDPQNILWSPTKKRLGKCNWTAEMQFADNAPLALMEVSTTPIA